MGLVALEGMRFHAYHGFYDEEQILGNYFVVDVKITTDIGAAAATDELHETINYEMIYEITRIVMEQPVRLLETLVDGIIAGLKHQFSSIQDVHVSIKKENPPLGGEVAYSVVEDSESYVIECGKCRRPMICYGDDDCWCKPILLHPRTREAIKQEFRGCICKKCLAYYAN